MFDPNDPKIRQPGAAPVVPPAGQVLAPGRPKPPTPLANNIAGIRAGYGSTVAAGDGRSGVWSPPKTNLPPVAPATPPAALTPPPAPVAPVAAAAKASKPQAYSRSQMTVQRNARGLMASGGAPPATPPAAVPAPATPGAVGVGGQPPGLPNKQPIPNPAAAPAAVPANAPPPFHPATAVDSTIRDARVNAAPTAVLKGQANTPNLPAVRQSEPNWRYAAPEAPAAPRVPTANLPAVRAAEKLPPGNQFQLNQIDDAFSPGGRGLAGSPFSLKSIGRAAGGIFRGLAANDLATEGINQINEAAIPSDGSVGTITDPFNRKIGLEALGSRERTPTMTGGILGLSGGGQGKPQGPIGDAPIPGGATGLLSGLVFGAHPGESVDGARKRMAGTPKGDLTTAQNFLSGNPATALDQMGLGGVNRYFGGGGVAAPAPPAAPSVPQKRVSSPEGEVAGAAGPAPGSLGPVVARVGQPDPVMDYLRSLPDKPGVNGKGPATPRAPAAPSVPQGRDADPIRDQLVGAANQAYANHLATQKSGYLYGNGGMYGDHSHTEALGISGGAHQQAVAALQAYDQGNAKVRSMDSEGVYHRAAADKASGANDERDLHRLLSNPQALQAQYIADKIPPEIAGPLAHQHAAEYAARIEEEARTPEDRQAEAMEERARKRGEASVAAEKKKKESTLNLVQRLMAQLTGK